MPELPEIEVLRRDLARSVCGATIRRLAVRERRLRRPLAADLSRRLCGAKIERVARRGKFLLFHLDEGRTLLVHLGMSGRLVLGGRGGVHEHVRILLDDSRVLCFADPRRFGLIVLVERDGGPCVGVEPLGRRFGPEYLWRACRGRRRAIKSLLMDQRIIAGIGNIYANEILHAAGVRPQRRAGRLRFVEVAAVARATGNVLRAAIRWRGSSISDYRDGFGRTGGFQTRLRVYGRGGSPCLRCAIPIRVRAVAGRSSFYCPRCQR